MCKLIKIHEVDEFSQIMSVPDAAISDSILSNVRDLREDTELEPFIREILYDPNETAHGPTEIADILTTHLHVRGDKRLAAFVLKGKSYKKVSSKYVTHQFAKLRQMPRLGLMVFLAVGSIQDDAHRDFQQTAIDADCDHLIVDAQDVARLLIAYQKICPKDGTCYDQMGKCKAGHMLDEGVTLEMRIREDARHIVRELRDVSHGAAKRYAATILLDRHYPKEVIRGIIEEATEKIKNEKYYRNEQLEQRWGETAAHAVALFLACDLEDIASANWLCRTQWIDPSLPQAIRPRALGGNEELGEIEVLEAISIVRREMVELAQEAIRCFEKYQQRSVSETDFIRAMQQREPRATELYRQAGNVPLPPPDVRDYEEACQELFAIVDNMFLYYSPRGLETWPRANRDWLMREAVRRFHDSLQRVEFEQRKTFQ